MTILLLGIFFSGCSLDDTAEMHSISNENLLGKWKLIKTSGGFGGNITEFDENDNSFVVEFQKDDFIRSKDGKELGRAKYRIIMGQSIRSTEDIPLIIYETGRRQSFEFRNGNLILFDECYDCFQNEYIAL